MKSASRAVVLATAAAWLVSSPTEAANYVIVVSTATYQDAAWRTVVDALQQKHQGRVFRYTTSVEQSLPDLQAWHPRYTCFVATPDEATREFVATVHRMTRRYDDDPYTDTLWGIVTGLDAAAALAIAQHDQPLVIHKVAAGTEFALEACTEGRWYDELVPGKQVHKLPGGDIETRKGPIDSTAPLVETLNEYRPDLFITSGHATQRDWMIGFSYRNGFFRSQAGQMWGEDTQSQRHEIRSTNPKVYMAVGNCLMGHIDGPDAMALAWMHSVGVQQMIGYTVPTWFGYAGWGCLDYFVEQPGRYTFAVTPQRGAHSFQPVNTNGSQRGWRPIIHFLPHRVTEIRILEGQDLQPIVTDDFVLKAPC